MEKNIQIKKDPRAALHKALFPVGLVTAITGFIWMIIQFSYAASQNPTKSLFDATRYIAIVVTVLSLFVCALIAATSILGLTKMKNIKHEITLNIVNAVVALLMLIFFVLSCTKIFDEMDYGVETFRKVPAYIGMLFSLSLYAMVYGNVANSKKLLVKSGNEVLVRSVAISAFVLSLAIAIPVFLILIGFTSEGYETLGQIASGGIFIAKFVVACLGSIGIAMLTTIVAVVLNKEGKISIVKYSVIAGIAFVFSIIIDAMTAMPDTTSSFIFAHTKTYGVFMLICWIATFVPSILAFKWSKVYLVKKQVVVKKSHK